ncbi:hypothetical protein LEN26_005891 [Aphanomyces euteiches]|nr:hypothetical protein AeMF1_021581 [Aphanomyces euteiches]KAH9137175.1 hypothetical protein LEN26_005891 [Aphanomyces euteiches]
MGCLPSTARLARGRSKDDLIVSGYSPRAILESPVEDATFTKRFSLFTLLRPIQSTFLDVDEPSLPEALKPLAGQRELDVEDVMIIRSIFTSTDTGEDFLLGHYNHHPVLVKRLHENSDKDLTKEIITLAKLHHPNIVSFIGFYAIDGVGLHCVTEFVEGHSLRETLENTQVKLTWESEKLAIALNIARAIAYLHAFKPPIIHRDIQAKSVLLAMNGTAKLTNFGSARERTFDVMMSHRGVGTLEWTAPEVLYGDDYNESIDVYSFGVVLIELDTRTTPFAGHTQSLHSTELMNQLKTGKLRPQVSASCPKEIARIARACLQHDPANRPKSSQVVAHLENALATQQENMYMDAAIFDFK